jgi:hypothetical protein
MPRPFSKGVNVTEDEKKTIQLAANAFVTGGKPGVYIQNSEFYAFLAGVQWRNKNPSPEVLALVEALEKIANPIGDVMMVIAREALAAWKDS